MLHKPWNSRLLIMLTLGQHSILVQYVTVTLPSFRNMALASSSFTLLADVQGYPDILHQSHLSSLASTIHSTLTSQKYKAQTPRLRRWTCVNINTFTPSAYRISITVLCSSLVQTESVADMFHFWQQLTQWQQGCDYQRTDMSHNQLQCSQLSKVFPHTSTHQKKKKKLQ
jgi:hypothetical protein